MTNICEDRTGPLKPERMAGKRRQPDSTYEKRLAAMGITLYRALKDMNAKRIAAGEKPRGEKSLYLAIDLEKARGRKTPLLLELDEQIAEYERGNR